MIIQRFLKIRSVKPNPALTVKMGYMRRHRPWVVQALFSRVLDGPSSRIYGLRAQTCWPDPAIAWLDLTFSPYYGFASAFLPGR